MPKKPKKSPAPLVLSPAEWMPLQEAYTRAKATSSRELAELDLREHMRSGELPSAMRGQDGTAVRLNKKYWDAHILIGEFIVGLSNVMVAENPVDALGRAAPRWVAGWFFVRRKELDKLYPPALRSDPSTRSDEPLLPIGGRRGPKPAHDWKKLAGRELARKASAGESVPTATEMCQWCIEQWGDEPEITHMSALIRAMRFLFDV
jgi:hypothetical protein